MQMFCIFQRVKCILHRVKESHSPELLLCRVEKSLMAILSLTAIRKQIK